MKNRIIVSILVIFLLLPLASCGAAADEGITFMIANDLHYISPTLLGDGEFFRDPQTRADGKLVHYSPEITDAFIAEVIERKPQALILAGDLTLNGAKVSHAELSAKLGQVKSAGIDVLVIPGNHDFDKTAVDYSGETLKEAEASTAADFFELYDPLLPEVLSREAGTFNYIYEADEDLWVLMLDSNTYAECYVTESTFDWLEENLKKAQDAGIDVIAVSHQNIYPHSDMLSFGYQLYNGSNLRALYVKYGVRCNFSAHVHIQSIVEEKKLPEIVTSALSVTGLHYGEIVSRRGRIEYSVRSLDADIEVDGYESFAEYATYYFEKIAKDQARSALADSGLSDGEIELMATTYAEINSAYFEGRPIRKRDYAEGIALWRAQGDAFISKYIDSMLGAVGREQKLKIK